jgi:uncharacterized protein YeaO (DUF488 family)
MVKTKSIHTKAEATDGLRILAARFRGRGIPSSWYDVWMPNLGPSEKLLKSVLSGKITWKEFSRTYREELFAGGGIDESNETIKNHGQKFTLRLLQHLAKEQTVTLLCHCAEDAAQCHRYLLQDLLSKKI